MIDHRVKSVNAWWPKAPPPGNFGDILTPFLIKKIFGYSAKYEVTKPFKNPTLIAVGSIASRANKFTTVWGSGLMSRSNKLSTEATYLSVRGPITRDRIIELGGECPDNFGDPALLMPSVYHPKNVRQPFEYGIFAHYVDTKEVSLWYRHAPNVAMINPLNSRVENVVNRLLKCKRIISSSLHGIIIAHAYGIPAVWVKHSNKLKGDDSKFYDYFESVGIKMKPIDFYERIPVEDFSKFEYVSEITFDPVNIIKPVEHLFQDSKK